MKGSGWMDVEKGDLIENRTSVDSSDFDDHTFI